MREFSKVSTNIWTSEKFAKLNEIEKLFYLYLLTCSHANSLGCYKIKIGYMCADLNWSETAILESIRRVSEVGLIIYDRVCHTVYISNWYAFNSPQNPKHAAKIINDLISIPYSILKQKIISDLINSLSSKKWKIHEKSQSILDTVSREESTKTQTKTQTETLEAVVPDAKLLCALKEKIGEVMGWNNNPNWFGDFSRLGAWLAEGWDADLDILPTIKRIKTNHRGEIKSLKYFEQAIADSYASRHAPTPKGNVNAGSYESRPTKTDRAKQALIRSSQALGIIGESGGTAGIDESNLSVFSGAEAVREGAGISGKHKPAFSNGAGPLPDGENTKGNELLPPVQHGNARPGGHSDDN